MVIWTICLFFFSSNFITQICHSGRVSVFLVVCFFLLSSPAPKGERLLFLPGLISWSAAAVLILPVFLCSAPGCSLTLCHHLDLLHSLRSSSGLLLKCSLLSPLPFSLVDSPTGETLHTAPSRFPITPTFQRRRFPFPFHIYRLRISFCVFEWSNVTKDLTFSSCPGGHEETLID